MTRTIDGVTFQVVGTSALELGTIPDHDALYTVALRLKEHTAGSISGKSGETGTSKFWDKGDLTIGEAVYCVQWSFTRGLNPFGDIHIWFHETIQVCEHYAIMMGWAQLRQPFTPKRFPFDDKLRKLHALANGDIGSICYVLTDSNQRRWQAVYKATLTALLTADIEINEALDVAERRAYDATCASAVGIVKKKEMERELKVKGWSWQQRADTRATRNAIRVSHGTPTPAEIRAYMAQRRSGPLTLDALTSPDLDPNSPSHVQDETIKYIDALQSAPHDKMTRDERVNLMRGDDWRDAPLGEDVASTPPDEKESSTLVELFPDIWDEIVDAIADEIPFFDGEASGAKIRDAFDSLNYDIDAIDWPKDRDKVMHDMLEYAEAHQD